MAAESERRLPLNRERVLRAAIELVDEGGLESLSMRKLGQVLGVEAMSLYNHVANKGDILGGMVELVLSEIELPSLEEDWETALRAFAISAHDALARHPWASNLIMSIPHVSPARLRYMDSVLGCLRHAGFSPEATYHAYHALDSHILGFTLWHQGHTLTKEQVSRFVSTILPTLHLDRYPYLAEHAEQHMTDGPHKDVSEFEFGLGLILDGLRRTQGAP